MRHVNPGSISPTIKTFWLKWLGSKWFNLYGFVISLIQEKTLNRNQTRPIAIMHEGTIKEIYTCTKSYIDMCTHILKVGARVGILYGNSSHISSIFT